MLRAAKDQNNESVRESEERRQFSTAAGEQMDAGRVQAVINEAMRNIHLFDAILVRHREDIRHVMSNKCYKHCTIYTLTETQEDCNTKVYIVKRIQCDRITLVNSSTLQYKC